MKSDSPYIAQMLECATKARRYVGEMSYEEFLKDEKTQSAVLMQLQQMGEMAKRVSDATKEEVDVPWKKVAGFRDVVAHDYIDVDLENAWKIISLDLAKTEASLTAYLNQHPLPKEEV
ncbi:MAG: HepT-like ribonuclease domain-containing protein [Patescibacteria group bacterium]